MNKKHWWWRPDEENVTPNNDAQEHSKTNKGSLNEGATNNNDGNEIIRDGFIINNDKNIDRVGSGDKTINNDSDQPTKLIDSDKSKITSQNKIGFTSQRDDKANKKTHDNKSEGAKEKFDSPNNEFHSNVNDNTLLPGELFDFLLLLTKFAFNCTV